MHTSTASAAASDYSRPSSPPPTMATVEAGCSVCASPSSATVPLLSAEASMVRRSLASDLTASAGRLAAELGQRLCGLKSPVYWPQSRGLHCAMGERS